MIETFVYSFPPFFQPLVADVLFYMYAFSPVYVPIGLAYWSWYLWRNYKRFLFRVTQNRILLEIKIPKEIKKTPLAMELFLNTLHQTGGEGTWYARSFEGKSRTWFSLEIVSTEGKIRFFIWTEKKFKTLLESQLYAQYPDVEIYEVDDYTKNVALDLNKQAIWGNEFAPTNKVDAYPIKTYVDYGLDKVGLKSEEIVDPITPIIEFLGSVGKGEQIWVQILVRAHKKSKEELKLIDKIKAFSWYGDEKDWTAAAKEEKEKLLKGLKADESGPMRIPTKVEAEVIEAMERNVTKLGFDCGIRGLYITEKDKFNAINITGMTGTFKQYNSGNRNGFKPVRTTSFDYPWEDFKNYRLNKKKREIFADYKRRAYFYYPFTSKNQFVLSTEELATIFHLPSGVVQTPTLGRIESKRSEPPANLPF